MNNVIYPDKLFIKEAKSLKLGIKSSFPKIHTSIALLYFLWKSNNMPFSLAYTKEINNDKEQFLLLSDDVSEHLLKYISKYRDELNLSNDILLSHINKNPLLTSQIEAIIVAFELVWKFAKIEFVDSSKSYSAERTNIGNRKVRFNKKIEFTNLVDILDILIQEEKEKYELDLFRWLIDVPQESSSNDNLAKLLTILSDESIYKIPLEDDDITFTMGGLYNKLSHENTPISITGEKESKGSLRILGSVLDNNINYFIEKKKNLISLSKNISKEDLENYSKRSLLRFELENIDLNELNSPLINDSKLNPQFDYSNILPLPKPFLLLAGVSGTGKSRFVRKQAEKTGEYQLVAVRPDWHEPSDLLGYVSRLSGKAEYVVTDVLSFIVRAWQAVEKAGLIANNEVQGSAENLAKVPPYWLCLDEMNLAPVEQYFADYLSVLETRKWKWEGDQFRYKTNALLSATAWKDVENFRKALKKDDSSEISDTLWNFFQAKGICIPFNLIVAGTVNMDETTHAFSRKVLDRALSFDFSKFYPNNFDEFFEPKTQPKLLGYPIASQAVPDEHSAKSIAFLTALNEKLANTPFELAYRALNELLLSVASFKPETDAALQAVWDDFVMIKILPRIEGDENKVGNLLADLEEVLKTQLAEIWEPESKRPDLWRENIDGSPLEIDCRCKPKLARMRNHLEERGMVSFW